MNIKSLLLGSAVAAVAATGAQAADAIIFAEPEPLEYVRICDTYGAGFFYIPGTQNCLRIGGYVRAQIDAVFSPRAASGFATLARFTPQIDARTATEWGTLRAYGEIDFNSTSTGASTLTTVAAFIDLGDESFVRIGRSWSPYSAWIRGTGGYGIRGGGFHLGTGAGNQLTYFFNTTNTTAPVGRAGFSGFISVLDRGYTDAVDVEGGVGYDWGGGWIRAAAYYDHRTAPLNLGGRTWGGKIGVGATVTDGFDVNLHALFQSHRGARISSYDLFGSQWGIHAAARYTASPEFSLHGGVEWYNRTPTSTLNWVGTVGATWQPFGNSSLQIIPEVNYLKNYARVGGASQWQGALRFQRNF